MDALVSTDVDGGVMLKSACNKSTVLVVSWCGIHSGGRTALVHAVGALTGFRYQDEILQHHVIPYLNVSGGMFQHHNDRPHMHVLGRNFCNATTCRHYFGQPVRRIKTQ